MHSVHISIPSVHMQQYTPVYISVNKRCTDPYTLCVRNTKGIRILTHPGHNAFSTRPYTLCTQVVYWCRTYPYTWHFVPWQISQNYSNEKLRTPIANITDIGNIADVANIADRLQKSQNFSNKKLRTPIADITDIANIAEWLQKSQISQNYSNERFRTPSQIDCRNRRIIQMRASEPPSQISQIDCRNRRYHRIYLFTSLPLYLFTFAPLYLCTSLLVSNTLP